MGTKGGIFITDDKLASKILTWSEIFRKIVNILYFQDHLNRHFYEIKKLTIVFNSNISLEVLNLLTLLSKKYSFITIKRIDSVNSDNTFDKQFMLNSFYNTKCKLFKSNLCLLININPRFEGTHLNLKLRQKVLKGNFKIASIGSLSNLTFPVQYLGSNLKVLKSITEGTHSFCQQLQLSVEPTIICSSEILKRKDSDKLIELLNNLKLFNSKNLNINNEINFLNTSINETGVYNLNNFKPLNYKDLTNSLGLYFLNNSFVNSNIKKLIELKSLNLFNETNSLDKYIIEHNHGIISNLSKTLIKSFNSANYVNLPNKTFFESSNTYINTTGSFKKNISCIPSIGKSKDDWSILRKIFSCTKHVDFVQCLNTNNKISFNSNNLTNFKNFINFNNYPVKIF